VISDEKKGKVENKFFFKVYIDVCVLTQTKHF
jgi:hypothetical protein